MGKAHNVVGNVHSRAAGLIDTDTFIQSSEHLEGHENENQHDTAGGGVD